MVYGQWAILRSNGLLQPHCLCYFNWRQQASCLGIWILREMVIWWHNSHHPCKAMVCNVADMFHVFLLKGTFMTIWQWGLQSLKSPLGVLKHTHYLRGWAVLNAAMPPLLPAALPRRSLMRLAPWPGSGTWRPSWTQRKRCWPPHCQRRGPWKPAWLTCRELSRR